MTHIDPRNANPDKHVPTCGTCGGGGNCMDCDTFSLQDARASLDELNRLKAIIPSRPLAPVTNARALKSVSEEIKEIEAYIARHKPAPIVEAAPADDIVTRLDNDPISHAETSVLMRRAADEIRRLRGKLAKAELAEDDDRRARQKQQELFDEYTAITEQQLMELRAEIEATRNAANIVIEALKNAAKHTGAATSKPTDIPRVLSSRWVEGWGFQGEVYLGNLRVYFTPNWYNDKNDAIKYAQVFADKLVAALSTR